ncbi:uncharacterized protein LOC122537823 [Frieseomelitta varia]|uniref:uncharacterized protein LOC122537823 n=1 Tax=Frieseomelitta varia TaxID=561572 RepID=UPI001CB68D9F|nr:uncharacterized protein LOC122537823 [Frieseomelitta varia]
MTGIIEPGGVSHPGRIKIVKFFTRQRATTHTSSSIRPSIFHRGTIYIINNARVYAIVSTGALHLTAKITANHYRAFENEHDYSISSACNARNKYYPVRHVNASLA